MEEQIGLQGLTLWRPWPYAILHPNGKRVENRPWKPPATIIGKIIALHAGKVWDYDRAGAILRELPEMPRSADAHPLGIVGVARVTGFVENAEALPETQRKWFFGPFGWLLDEVTPLSRHVPCRGAQGLWPVPHAIAALVKERREEASK